MQKNMMETVFAYLVDMKEEYGEVKEDDDEEGQDEDDDQRGEDPQQVLQNTQIVLQLTEARPLLPLMEHTHLWNSTHTENTCSRQYEKQKCLLNIKAC